MHLRAVLFDVDHALLDFLRMKRMASDAAARAMVRAGADFPFGSGEAGDILFGSYLQDLEGDTVFERFLRENHQQKLALSQHAVDRITAAAVNAYLDAKRLHLEPHATVPRTLLELARRGLRMGAVSRAPRFKAYQRLDAARLTDFLDVVVAEPQLPLRGALELLDAPPQAVLAVGDAAMVAQARELGMRTAWAMYAEPDATPPTADDVLRRFADVLKVTAFHTPA